MWLCGLLVCGSGPSLGVAFVFFGPDGQRACLRQVYVGVFVKRGRLACIFPVRYVGLRVGPQAVVYSVTCRGRAWSG